MSTAHHLFYSFLSFYHCVLFIFLLTCRSGSVRVTPPPPPVAGATGGAAGVPFVPINYEESNFVIPNFKFHDGSVLNEIVIHYRTFGNRTGQPVLMLHGSSGSGAGFLEDGFNNLFIPGAPLDQYKYFMILPDSLGCGNSTRPSNGLRTRFPRYNYLDMVVAQQQLVVGLRVPHLRAIVGVSMGGMHTWLWGITFPGYSDLLVPTAATPLPMSGRNWVMRRFFIDSIKNDPNWHNGNYIRQPSSLYFASSYFGLATNGGILGLQAKAPTRILADILINNTLAQAYGRHLDANDLIYVYDASRDYDPLPNLNKIGGTMLLAVLSTDDERNPPELDYVSIIRSLGPRANVFIIPGSYNTSGHSTVEDSRLWEDALRVALQSAPFLYDYSKTN